MTDKIPRIIHQLWLQTERYVPKLFKDYSTKIKEINGDFKYVFWDENTILDLIKDNEKYMKTYYSFSYMHQKIDFAKYIILYTFGGIFIDMDAYTIRKLSDLYTLKTDSGKIIENYDVVVSYITGNSIESMFMCRQTKCVNNGNILCKPGADFMKYMINEIINGDGCGDFTPKMICIQNTTGPILINSLIKKYDGPSDIKILDAEYLEPCIKNDCKTTKNTYILHKHAQTWIDGPIQKVVDFYFNNKILILIIFIAIILYMMRNKIRNLI
jgi:mannosyltransferase OCH1-like enzyme